MASGTEMKFSTKWGDFDLTFGRLQPPSIPPPVRPSAIHPVLTNGRMKDSIESRPIDETSSSENDET
jgi:hypothetical protein